MTTNKVLAIVVKHAKAKNKVCWLWPLLRDFILCSKYFSEDFSLNWHLLKVAN